MAAVFPDQPEALANTVQIAEMCEFNRSREYLLPAFDVPPGFTIESYFEKVTRDGFDGAAQRLAPAGRGRRGCRYPLSEYEERLD